MPRHIKTAALAGTAGRGRRQGRAPRSRRSSPMSARAATRRCANFSERFDKWSPPSFRLSEDEIAALVAKVVAADDRRHQIRASADPQFRRDPARLAARCRGRDLARRRARPSPHPGRQCRLLCAGRALSDGRLGAYVDRHREGRRGRPHHRLHAAEPGRPAPRDDRGDASGRRRRDLCAGRRPGGRGDGARHRDASSRSTCWSAPATPMSPRPSASSTAGSASTCSPARPRSWSSPTRRADAEMCATDLLGQAEHGPTSPAILLTTSEKLAHDDDRRSRRASSTVLPTADVAGVAWRDYGEVILCADDDEMVGRGRPHRRRACRGADPRAAQLARPAARITARSSSAPRPTSPTATR